MGNSESQFGKHKPNSKTNSEPKTKPNSKPKFGKLVVNQEGNIQVEPDSFGSYKNPENPRPGYYINKRKGQVYYRGRIISGADSETFRKLGQGRAEDKNYKYLKGEIVKSFEKN